jgi:putative transposase
MVVKRNQNITHNCTFHVVWCPKYRRKVLTGTLDDRLKEIIEQVCAEKRCDIIQMETMPDHVHLLVQCDPQFGIHKLVKLIKGRSSNLLRTEFPDIKKRLPTLWTNSYFVATVGDVSLEKVRAYVENQRNV